MQNLRRTTTHLMKPNILKFTLQIDETRLYRNFSKTYHLLPYSRIVVVHDLGSQPNAYKMENLDYKSLMQSIHSCSLGLAPFLLIHFISFFNLIQ